jgi:hypothetical protein
VGFINQGTTVAITCDACGVPLSSAGAPATVGLHGRELVFVHENPHCKGRYQQFFLNDKQRELSLAAFLAELAAL